jgi:hypothetical protein
MTISLPGKMPVVPIRTLPNSRAIKIPQRLLLPRDRNHIKPKYSCLLFGFKHLYYSLTRWKRCDSLYLAAFV